MSNQKYFDVVAIVRYGKKLKLVNVGLRMCPNELDPVAWIDIVRLWPPAEFPNFVVYDLQAPGKYIWIFVKNIRPTKDLKHFFSDWIGATLYYHNINVDFCVLKAAVSLSQRLSEKPNHPWVCVRLKDGSWFCIVYCYYSLILCYIDILNLYCTATLPVFTPR